MTRALFFVGPTKTSTTSIWHALKDAGVRMPITHKETFFFDRYFKGDRAAYLRQHFGGSDADFVEVSPSYFAVAEAANRIREIFPHARIVITLREPIARTVSLYRHLLRYGWIEDMGIAEAIETVPADLFPGTGYRAGCAHWLDVFDPNNVLILKQNEDGAFDDAVFPAVAAFSGIAGVAAARLPGVRHNRSMAARSQKFTRLTAKLSLFLRQNNAAPVVALGKKLGLSKLIYKENSADVRPVSDRDLQTLARVLARDMDLYERLESGATSGRQVRALVNTPQAVG